MKPTSLWGIAKKASSDKTHRFRNLYSLLTAGFLLWCWDFIHKRAAPGVDKQTAADYEENLLGNIQALVEQVKEKRYRAKLVLRKYIPKLNGKRRPLGLPAIADKLLQTAVAKILEAIYEQDFLACSYGYRPGIGAHDALKDLSVALGSGRYHYVVEADIQSFFDHIDHDHLLAMLAQRIDDKPFLNLIRKWLKAGILETDHRVIHPQTGTPQGGTVSPVLSNIYLHHVLDTWFETVVKAHCRGEAYLCRYADDFVCAFQDETDAQRFYHVLGKRLGRYGLNVAADKTRLLRFSRVDRKRSAAFEFLGFEFRWEFKKFNPVIKRRTARKKYRAALAEMRAWSRTHCRLPKRLLFDKLNRKLRGYYHYYGLRGNFESLSDYFFQIKRILFRVLNRRSQRKSYNWKGFEALAKAFKLQPPRICHSF